MEDPNYRIDSKAQSTTSTSPQSKKYMHPIEVEYQTAARCLYTYRGHIMHLDKYAVTHSPIVCVMNVEAKQ